MFGTYKCLTNHTSNIPKGGSQKLSRLKHTTVNTIDRFNNKTES